MSRRELIKLLTLRLPVGILIPDTFSVKYFIVIAGNCRLFLFYQLPKQRSRNIDDETYPQNSETTLKLRSSGIFFSFLVEYLHWLYNNGSYVEVGTNLL